MDRILAIDLTVKIMNAQILIARQRLKNVHGGRCGEPIDLANEKAAKVGQV